MSQSERLNQIFHLRFKGVLQIVVLAYQGVGLLALVVIPFLAIQWMRTPFLGAFVEQTMVFNGVGISQEDQKKIFQKFFRSGDSKARKSPGTGLGLNITRSLVEMMGGRIWFESEFRQGTTFHFTVPVAEG